MQAVRGYTRRMLKPLLVIIAIGAGIGLMVPGDKPRPPAKTVAADAAVDDGQPRDTVLEKRSNGHFYVDATVNGQLVNFVVDTGATVIALTVDDARRIGIPFSESGFTVVAQGASGPVRGQNITVASVSVDGKAVMDLEGAVLEGLGQSLLGQAYLSRISSVRMSGDYMTLK